MERGAMDKLKFDKRLARRRGWVDGAELDAHNESLPDVAEKRWIEESDSDAEGEVSEPASTDPAPVSESTPSPGSGF